MSAIFITGANEGIGFYMCRALLEAGHSVAALDVDTSNLAALAASSSGSFLYYEADVRDAAAVQSAVNDAANRFSGLDAAVHNACRCPFLSFGECEDGDFLSAYYVNYFGAVHLARATVPHLKTGGRICFTSSGVGVTGFPGLTAYASSKGAIEALAKCLRLEYPQFSFHILHPPLTRTRSSSPLPVPPEFMASPEDVGRGLAKRLFSKRFIICHSRAQAVQTRLCYAFPLKLGRLISLMTSRASSSRT